MKNRVLLWVLLYIILGSLNTLLAQDSLLQVLAKDKNQAETYLKLGKYYYKDSIHLAEEYLNQGILVAEQKEKTELLNQLFYMKARIAKRKAKPQEAIQLFRKSEYHSIQIHDTLTLININRMLGNIYREQSQYIQAQQYFSNAYNYASKIKDTLLQVNLLIDQGYIYNYWAKNDTALFILNLAHKSAEQIQYNKGLARITTLIGNIYFSLEEYEKALKYYRSSFYLAQKIESPIGEGVSLINIGISLSALSDYKNAIDTLKYSLDILAKSQIPNLIANAYGNLSTIYADSGLYTKAFESMDSCTRYYQMVNSKESLSILHFLKSDVFFKAKLYSQSIQSLDSCMQYVEAINFEQMREKAYLSYIRANKMMGKYQEAFHFFEKYDAAKDSSLNQKMQQQLMDFEAKYKTLEKQKEIEALSKDKHITELNRDKRKMERNILITAFILVITLLIAFIQKRRKEKQLEAIQREKDLLEKREMEQKLTFQSKQLTSHALNMLQNNELLLSLRKELENLKTEVNKDTEHKVKRILSQINLHLNKKAEWELFKMYFEEVHNDFFVRVRKVSINLTSGDERMIALIKLNLNVKEIAAILNISPDSVKNARHRLRKKLSLNTGDDLYLFLSRL